MMSNTQISDQILVDRVKFALSELIRSIGEAENAGLEVYFSDKRTQPILANGGEFSNLDVVIKRTY